MPTFAVRLASFNSSDLSLPSLDRKSTRLNSSHGYISYAVFCLKKKKKVIFLVTTNISKIPKYLLSLGIDRNIPRHQNLFPFKCNELLMLRYRLTEHQRYGSHII